MDLVRKAISWKKVGFLMAGIIAVPAIGYVLFLYVSHVDKLNESFFSMTGLACTAAATVFVLIACIPTIGHFFRMHEAAIASQHSLPGKAWRKGSPKSDTSPLTAQQVHNGAWEDTDSAVDKMGKGR